jgi:hypothetical protein
LKKQLRVNDRLHGMVRACQKHSAWMRRKYCSRLRHFASVFLFVLGFQASAGFAAGVVSGCTEVAFRQALVGGGSITFTGDCSITLSQQIPIFQRTTVDALGHNVVISGGNAVALFDVATNLTLRGVSLVNGRSTSSGAALHIHSGAVVVVNGCFFGGNSVTATNGVFGNTGTTNSAGTGFAGTDGMNGPSAFGGCIYNLGDLALISCVFTNNSVIAGAGGAGGSGGNGGGAFEVGGNGGNGGLGGLALGGAVYNLANATVVNCLFSGNTATGGNGGAGGAGGTGNNAGFAGNGGAGGIGYGGAFYNGQNLTLSDSTFSTNSAVAGNSATAGTGGNGTGNNGSKGADASGGALFNAWWGVATNCTFYTNTVFGGNGGTGGTGGGTFGIPGNGGDGGDGIGGSIGNANTLTVVTCTLSSGAASGGTNGVAGTGNFTGSSGQPGTGEGGNIANSGGELSVFGTILTSAISGQNAFGQFTDLGYNLSSDSTSSFGALSSQNTDPRLGPLTFNGGPTPTMALLSGSPAIDRIPAALSPRTDQRGFARPVNGRADIGAFEFGAAVASSNVTLTATRVTNGSFQLSAQGTAGLNYIVQASTNLVSWQSISTNLAPIQFTDSVTNLPSRFYRLSR